MESGVKKISLCLTWSMITKSKDDFGYTTSIISTAYECQIFLINILGHGKLMMSMLFLI